MESDAGSSKELILGRLFTSFGIVALVSVWITVAISWYFNSSWFNFRTGALSAFGSPGANYPSIYNIGIIITSVFLFLFSVSLIYRSKNKVETVASAFLVIASLFLTQIGIYHGGTYPHDYVSTYFFLQTDISLLIWGIALMFRKAIRAGIFTLVIGLAFAIIAVTVPLPGAAILETYGILTFGAWAFVMNSYSLTHQ